MPSEFDKYIGQCLCHHRVSLGISVQQAACALDISEMSYRNGENGLRRFFISEIFVIKKILGIPIDDFFTFDGIYISDLIKDKSSQELVDLIHYFPNIKDANIRQLISEKIRDASSVF